MNSLILFNISISVCLLKVARKLRRNGFFIFNFETVDPEECFIDKGFRLQQSCRFGYTLAYVNNMILRSSLDIKFAKNLSPRNDAGSPVNGYLYLLRKR